MISLEHVTKIYKLSKSQMKKTKSKSQTKTAVDDLSFCAKDGEILGLLGPNGAGKTTTLRCLSTLIKPTEGEITVQGFDVHKDAQAVRASIGFLTNEIKLDPQFTPNYLFHFFGRMHNVPEDVIEKRRQELFSYFGILEFENKKISELSTGMKQKAAIAVSLVHDPEVVIFDEPTSGLDIITARAVVDYLKILKDKGKLVIISTHIMSEAQKLCDRIVVIIDGKKAAEGTVDELYELTHTTDLEDAFFELYKMNHKEEA